MDDGDYVIATRDKPRKRRRRWLRDVPWYLVGALLAAAGLLALLHRDWSEAGLDAFLLAGLPTLRAASRYRTPPRL